MCTLIGTAYTVCRAGSVKCMVSIRLSVHPSICLSHLPVFPCLSHSPAAAACSGFAAVGPPGRRYGLLAARGRSTVHSSKCGPATFSAAEHSLVCLVVRISACRHVHMVEVSWSSLTLKAACTLSIDTWSCCASKHTSLMCHTCFK